LLEVRDLSFGYTAEALLFRKLHLTVNPQDRIGVIGNIQEWKGQLVLVEAMAGIVGRFPAARALMELSRRIAAALLESESVTAEQIGQLAARHSLAEEWRAFEARFLNG